MGKSASEQAVVARSESALIDPARVVFRVAVVIAVFCVNSLIVIELSSYSSGLAAIWSANACLIFALMISPRREHVFYLMGSFCASFLVNLTTTLPAGTAFVFSLSNIFEAWLAWYLLSRLGFPKTGLYDPNQLIRFALIAVFVSSISASMSLLNGSETYLESWFSWFGSDLLGILIFLPCLNIMHENFSTPIQQTWRDSNKLEFAAVIIFNLSVCLLIFGQSTFPLMFLSVLPMLVSVFRFGACGAVASTFTVAIVAETATHLGFGPIAALSAPDLWIIFVLQAYIAGQLLSALPIASVLADRRNKAKQLLESEKSLRLAAQMARRDAELEKRKNIKLFAQDELTGLSSRRRTMAKLTLAINIAQTKKSSLTIAIFDVDNFKRINDSYGHAVGDDMLRMIGRISLETVPKKFTVGRIGGEEFLVIMPGVETAETEKEIESLRAAIMQARLPIRNIGATISIGLASIDQNSDLRRLLVSADQALFSAKKAGRNQMAIAA